MNANQGRLKFWGWGYETERLTPEEVEPPRGCVRAALRGVPLRSHTPCRVQRKSSCASLACSAPRGLGDFCSVDHYERLLHSYGKSFFDSVRVFARDFSNPPDVIAFPRSEGELVSTLAWCDSIDAVVIPWGGGSSVVAGVEPPRTDRPIVTVDLKHLDRVLEIDDRLAGCADSGRRVRPVAGEPAQSQRADAAPLSAIVRVFYPRRLDRDARWRPLRDALHSHRRFRREPARGHAGRDRAVLPPAGLRGRPQSRSHVHRLGGHARHHHRGVDEAAPAADLSRWHQRALQGFLPRCRGGPRHRPGAPVSGQLPVARCRRGAGQRRGRRHALRAGAQLRVGGSSDGRNPRSALWKSCVLTTASTTSRRGQG